WRRRPTSGCACAIATASRATSGCRTCSASSRAMDIAILGAGAWGSALAVSWSSTHRVRLWTRARVDAEALTRTRESRYLPGVTIPASVAIVGDFEAAVARAELVVVATSTAGLRETATRLHAID